MTESEKAQLGQLYNANHDPQLLNKRTWAKNLCMEYNQLRWDEGAKRTALLQELLGICGEDAVIEPSFYVDYGKNICIGRGFYANHNLVILDGATVTIGNNVFIGPNCTISTAGHPFEVKLRREGLEYAKSITIGSNVWIGMGTQICPGVTIGDNAVIGAGSVVTHDIPENSFAAGVPCRVIREISESDSLKYKPELMP